MDRLIGFDPQLLHDAVLTGINIFILFFALSYLLFNPVRDVLEKRKQKIAGELASAAEDKASAESMLEKKKALDDMKQEIVDIAAYMAEKVVGNSIDVKIQDALIDETLKEMGEHTWQS